MYTVIDVETTGGASRYHKITEIAIIKFDGSKVIDQFISLVNPGQTIPAFITSLTGIDDDMVAEAPAFGEIADKIFDITRDQIFVAHNVNFDYGFVKNEFDALGVKYDRKKLCTVRLARKIMPGLSSYGLGNLSQNLGIQNDARHRAYGDAEATVKILKYLIDHDNEGFIDYSLKRNSKEATLPPNLERERYEALPNKAGVYYFHNQRGKVIYVGKARNIRSRVTNHFTGESGKEKRLFLNNIFDISHEVHGNELIALLEESREIKRLWPEYNRSQKYYTNNYGLHSYEDQNGYIRLFIAKGSKGEKPVASFRTFNEARMALMALVKDYELCPRLCGMQKTNGPCYHKESGDCKGACTGEEIPTAYNSRIDEAIESIGKSLHTFALVGSGREKGEKSVVLVENGTYLGHGFADESLAVTSLDQLKEIISNYPDNQDIQRIIGMYVKKPKDNLLISLGD